MAASSRLSGRAKKSPTNKYKYQTQQIQLQIQENMTESGGK